MKINFLGTRGWFANCSGNTNCVLIDSNNFYLVLDAGDGIYKLDQFVKNDKKPIYLFLTHLHIDHIAGLHILPKFNFLQGLTIFVPKGRKKDLETFVNPPFTYPIYKNKYEIKVEEVDEGCKYDKPFNFETYKLHHAYLDFGYKYKIENKVIAYAGDTGPCDNLNKLAKDCDVLICECSNQGNKTNHEWGHLNVYEICEIAREARVKKLLLTHLPINNSKEDNEKLEKEGKKIFENCEVVWDGREISI